ncbi:hypothetical protein CASFOL_025054 [Castilleja foliolosa]|uniref:MORF/ORRM1/DAG-like MORF domain-containing protein n=1 Tax=Castilleja foliolosa TaxID=1961234 RepID=A0ABD3CQ34_9LAMI
MMRKVILLNPSNLTAAIFRRHSASTFHITHRRLFSDEPASSNPQAPTRVSNLPRVDSLVDGCDYKHWLVVMHPPENYPQREEIVQQYVTTLSQALGSEKRAMESIYSVSTKYYYAFSCKLDENMIHKIKSLPRVKWVLPDSYLSTQESGYGVKKSVLVNHTSMEKLFHTTRNIMLTGCAITMVKDIRKEIAHGGVEEEEDEVQEIPMLHTIELLIVEKRGDYVS